MVEVGPIPSAHDVVRWRRCELAQWTHDECKLLVTFLTLGEVRWVIASLLPGRAIVARRTRTSSILKSFASRLPKCNSEAMRIHFKEIVFHVAPGAHVILILDHAGWRGSVELVIPLLHHADVLSDKVPRVQSSQNVRQFMRDNCLSSCIFKTYDDIADHYCFAWNKLVEQPCASCSSESANGFISSSLCVLVLAVEPRIKTTILTQYFKHDRYILNAVAIKFARSLIAFDLFHKDFEHLLCQSGSCVFLRARRSS